jgi:two-component system sensor histidine kinase TctE
LLVSLLVPLIALLTADTFLSYWTSLRFAERAYDRSLLEIAREVALYAGGKDGSLTFDVPESARKILLSDPSDHVYYEVATADERLVAGESLPPSPDARARKSVAEVFYDGRAHGEAVRIVELPLAGDRDTGRPPAVVRVAETENKRNELAREILASVVLPQILLIMLAGALVWAGVARGLSPLERVRRAIASRSHRDRRPLEEDGVPGEVRPLLHSINGLLERLDKVLTLQSRFIADAAHQLKTPVAGLMAQMEVVLREVEAARIREGVARLYIGMERLSRLVSQLLSLARNEPDGIRLLTLVPVDLDALMLEVTTAWVPAAYAKNIDLGLEKPEHPTPVAGDAARMREMFDNLLDNAIRYSRSGGRVTVRVTGGPRPIVSVSDDGPTIPPAERQRVFERFHRLQSGEAGIDGSGLGLAIADEIARIHGAEIALHDDADGIGNTFSVTFPAA